MMSPGGAWVVLCEAGEWARGFGERLGLETLSSLCLQWRVASLTWGRGVSGFELTGYWFRMYFLMVQSI